MRRLILLGIVAVLAISGCARDEPRPSGVAEAYLHEISRIGGPVGLRDDAVRRAGELGDVEAADLIIPGNPEGAERDFFSDLEVGQARLTDDGTKAQVPFRVTARTRESGGGRGTVIKAGTLTLNRTSGEWRVTAATGPVDGLEVPSQGGPLPARAQPEHWLSALLLGFVLTGISVVVVERQPRPTAV